MSGLPTNLRVEDPSTSQLFEFIEQVGREVTGVMPEGVAVTIVPGCELLAFMRIVKAILDLRDRSCSDAGIRDLFSWLGVLQQIVDGDPRWCDVWCR